MENLMCHKADIVFVTDMANIIATICLKAKTNISFLVICLYDIDIILLGEFFFMGLKELCPIFLCRVHYKHNRAFIYQNIYPVYHVSTPLF